MKDRKNECSILLRYASHILRLRSEHSAPTGKKLFCFYYSEIFKRFNSCSLFSFVLQFSSPFVLSVSSFSEKSAKYNGVSRKAACVKRRRLLKAIKNLIYDGTSSLEPSSPVGSIDSSLLLYMAKLTNALKMQRAMHAAINGDLAQSIAVSALAVSIGY